MNDHQPAIGIDLARLALRRARADAAKRGDSVVKAKAAGRTTEPRRGRADPVGLGAALSDLMVQHAWQEPLAGGGLLDLWPAAVGELANHVTAVSFDHQTGRLDVRAESPAYATHVRTLAPALVATLNQANGETILRSIRVLGGHRAPATAGARPATRNDAPAPEPKIKTREDASPGYLRALAQLQASRPSAPADSRTSPAVDRRIRTLARGPETAPRLSGPRPR
ncbi:DciA family protein [Kitasatospora sp. NPDC056184]|uniref:DciA family protein n=1 Tax=Kitasatospora sp. NPDC056184 TaxID=3345738 RepID=UPI0035DBB58D